MKDARELEGVPPHIGPREALGMVLLCFGSFIVSSLAAVSNPGAIRLVGFNDNSFAALIVLELVLGTTALMVLHARRYPLRTLYPRASWRGVLAGAGLYLCATLLTTLAYRLVPHGDASPLGDMLAGSRVSWYSVVPMALVNGSYEEIFLLAYLMRGLRRFGASTAIGITVLVRVLYHMYQGPMGALSVALFGIVLGMYYHYRGRLFPVVLAHVVADMLPFL